MKNTREIGKAVKAQRVEMEMTQEEYGKRFGVTGATISRIESNKQESIDDDLWGLMEKDIKPFMKPGETEVVRVNGAVQPISSANQRSVTIICNQVHITLSIAPGVAVDIQTENKP